MVREHHLQTPPQRFGQVPLGVLLLVFTKSNNTTSSREAKKCPFPPTNENFGECRSLLNSILENLHFPSRPKKCATRGRFGCVGNFSKNNRDPLNQNSPLPKCVAIKSTMKANNDCVIMCNLFIFWSIPTLKGVSCLLWFVRSFRSACW